MILSGITGNGTIAIMLRGRKVRQRPQSWSSVSTKPESHQNLNTLLPLHHNTQIVAARFKTVNTCAAIRFKQAPHRRQHSDDCKRVLWRIFPQCDRFFLCSAIVKISVVTTFLLLLVVQWAEPNAFSPRRRKLSVLSIAHNFQLSFPVQKTKLPKSFFNLPAPFDDLQRRVSSFRHHGGLHIETNVKFSDSGILSTREISQDYRDTLGYEALVSPAEVNNESDDVQGYYAFDDDLKRDPHADFDHVDTGGRPKCRRTSWHRDLPINCNNVRFRCRLPVSPVCQHTSRCRSFQTYLLFTLTRFICSSMNLMLKTDFWLGKQITLGM